MGSDGEFEKNLKHNVYRTIRITNDDERLNLRIIITQVIRYL